MKKNILLKLSICSFIFTSCSTWNTLWLPETASTPALRTTASNKDDNEKDCANEWIAIDNHKDSQIRSNPAHYWCWISKNMPSELQNLVTFKGPVTGDPHYFNFGDVHRKKGTPEGDLTLVDVDDSGYGSYIYDLIRYAIFVRAYNKDSEIGSLKDLIDSYKAGLKQNINYDVKTPEYVNAAVATPRKHLMHRHKEWVKENTKKDQLDYKKLDLKPIAQLSLEQKTLLKKLSPLLEEKTEKKIKDVGFTVYDSGSSNGLIRYWFLIKNPKNENMYIKECKALSKPAVALANKDQKNPLDRIESVLKPYSTFRTDVEKDSFVLTVDNQNSFWCRYREFQAMKRGPVKKMKNDRKKMAQLSEYFAFWLGSKISYQTNGKKYLDSLDKTKNLDNQINDLLNTYEKVFNRLNKNGLKLSDILENSDNQLTESDDTPYSPLSIYTDAADDDE